MSDTTPIPPEDDSIQKIEADIAKLPVSEGDALKQILKLVSDDKGRAMFLRIISVSKLKQVRPLNYKKSSNLPYYRVEFGQWMKRSVDKMVETQQEVIFLYSDYKVGRRTLQQRCFQAFDFLVNEMDDVDSKYATLRDRIAITKEPQGIKLAYKRMEDLDKEASLITYDNDTHRKLKEDVIDFLEKADLGSKFERSNLQLDDETVTYFEMMVANLTHVRLICRPDMIKIIKLTDEMLKVMQDLEVPPTPPASHDA